MEKMLSVDDYGDKADVFRLILETEGYQAKAVDIGIKVIKESEEYRSKLITH